MAHFLSSIYTELEQFIVLLLQAAEHIITPKQPVKESLQGEQSIRDINDRPIYRAAIVAQADIIITGDKDLLDSGLPHPQIMTAATFMQE